MDETQGIEVDAREQFSVMIEPLLNGLYRYALHLTGHRETAEDVVHDAVIRAMQKVGQLRDTNRFRGWMYRIVRNTFVNQYAKDQRRLKVIEGTTPDAIENLADESMVQSSAEKKTAYAQEWKKVIRTLRGIPEIYRSVLWLYYVEELTLEEVASINNVPLGTAASRLYRGRQMLFKSLVSA